MNDFSESFALKQEFTDNLEKAKNLIDDAIDTFETCSMKIGRQFADEKQVVKTKRNEYTIEATKLWDSLTEEQYLKIVKKGLPLTARLFHKIYVFSSGVTSSGDIFFAFSFDHKQVYFERKCSISEIKDILKL